MTFPAGAAVQVDRQDQARIATAMASALAELYADAAIPFAERQAMLAREQQCHSEAIWTAVVELLRPAT